MRQIFPTILLGVTVMGSTVPGLAQVVINPQALQQLSGAPAPKHSFHTVTRPVAPHPPLVRHVIVHRATVRRTLPLPPPLPPVVRAVKPLAAVAKPVPPVRPRAVTLRFAHVAVTLGQAQAKAVEALIGPKLDEAAHFVVQATAPGVPGDPSVARRMALNRGLAVRAVLRRAGVKSDHIIVQALGDPPGLVPDHVTLTEEP